MASLSAAKPVAAVGRCPAGPRRARRGAVPSGSHANGLQPCSVQATRSSVVSSGRRALVCRASVEPTSTAPPAGKPSTSPETLFKLTREFIETGSGYFSPAKEELFSEEFVFRGPVIGPLCKKDYLVTLNAFSIHKIFPDIQSNSWGYSIDPQEPNRVWFFVRQTGTNTGEVTLPPLPVQKATGLKATLGPEVYSIMFDEGLKVKLLTVGYPCDFDAPNTNSNKFGAVVGILKAVGVELPAGPLFGLSQKLGSLAVDAGVLPSDTPKSYSKWEDVPAWYKAYTPKRVGSEGAPGY
uniref:Uncharacterized protein n=1 Tax=Tetraselmis chuii TaxID=63592 RepID=A0A7S1T7T1_9CHLO